MEKEQIFGETISPYGDSSTDLAQAYEAYLKDSRNTLESEDGVFYRIVSKTRYYKGGDNAWMVVAYIPEGVDAKTAVDENFNEFTVGSFPPLKFGNAVPEWYKNLKVFSLNSEDSMNLLGEYLSYK